MLKETKKHVFLLWTCEDVAEVSAVADFECMRSLANASQALVHADPHTNTCLCDTGIDRGVRTAAHYPDKKIRARWITRTEIYRATRACNRSRRGDRDTRTCVQSSRRHPPLPCKPSFSSLFLSPTDRANQRTEQEPQCTHQPGNVVIGRTDEREEALDKRNL